MAKKLNKDTPEINSVDADLKDVLEDVTGVKKEPAVIYHNAPENLDSARDRIMELEMRLGDLHRACEIAVVCKDFSLMESFLAPSEEALANKIVVEYPQTGPMKITIVTDKKEEDVTETS
jgi:hypothetical protein